MKKLILGLVATTLLMQNLFAWTETNIDIKNNGNKIHYIVCNNGLSINIIESHYFKQPFLGKNNIRYSSIEKAINSYCIQNMSKIVIIKKGSIVFKKKKGNYGIESYLTSETNYNFAKMDVKLGKKDLFILSSNAKVKLETCYPIYDVIVDNYKNYKNTDPNKFQKLKKGIYKKIPLIESYCKIYDEEQHHYYVRKQDIQ